MDRPAPTAQQHSELALVERAPVDDALRDAALRAANRRPWRARYRWFIDWLRVFPAAVALFLVMRTVLVEAYKIPSGSMEQTLLVGDFLLVNKLVYGATIPLANVRLPAMREPSRGDIVVFEWPTDPSKNFVKRLIGLPGDTVQMIRGELWLNGVRQAEQYAVHTDPGTDAIAEDFKWQRSYLVRTAAASPAVSSTSSSAVSSVLSTTLAAASELESESAVAVSAYRPSRNTWGPLVVPAKHFFVLGDNRDNSLDSRYWGFVADSLLRGSPIIVYYSYAPDSTATLPWITNIRWRRLGERIQ
jgi:signal peptidase I